MNQVRLEIKKRKKKKKKIRAEKKKVKGDCCKIRKKKALI